MKPVIVAALAAGLALPLSPGIRTPSLATSDAVHRAGMILAQYGAPKEDEPGADAEQTPEEDPQAPGPTTPPDNEGDSNIAPPPGATVPPGCIFNKGPLELIV